MIYVWCGLTGAGKTTMFARTAMKCFYKNARMLASGQTKVPRKVWINTPFSEEVEAEFREFIGYWTDPEELIAIRDADIFWDEMPVNLDATRWADMPLTLKAWFRQHRKRGIDIYGTAQDYFDIDKSVRRLVHGLKKIQKIAGTRDLSATLPPPKNPWTFNLSWELDPRATDEGKLFPQASFQFPGVHIFYGSDFKVFDTTKEIAMGKYPPLKHIERVCEDPDCKVHVIRHV